MRKALIVLALIAPFLASPALFEPLWTLLTAATPPPHSDAGCGMDPYGGCNPGPPPQTDAGCGFAPLGCPEGS